MVCRLHNWEVVHGVHSVYTKPATGAVPVPGNRKGHKMLPYRLLRASPHLLAGAPSPPCLLASSPHLLASSPHLLASTPHLLHTAAPAPQAQGEVARWGPDRLLPANSLTTSWPDGCVELRTHPHPSSDYLTRSVWTMLHQTVARWGPGGGQATGAGQGAGPDGPGRQAGRGLDEVELCRVPAPGVHLCVLNLCT